MTTRGGLNGSFKIFLKISKLSEPGSGTNDNTKHSEQKHTSEWKLIVGTEVNHMIDVEHITDRI